MKTMDEAVEAEPWVSVCSLSEIVPNTGVCCLVGAAQVAVFRLDDDRLYAIGNYDPFSRANVLSRGIVGDRAGRPKVTSPIYKQPFSLESGECMDDPNVRVPTYRVRVRDGIVQVHAQVTEAIPSRNNGLLTDARTA